MIEVGHCKECCQKYDTHKKCNPNSPLIKHLEKDKCSYCNNEEIDNEKVLMIIGEVWQETRKHFGNDFPFEYDLKFIIIDKGKEFPGKIVIEPKIIKKEVEKE